MLTWWKRRSFGWLAGKWQIVVLSGNERPRVVAVLGVWWELGRLIAKPARQEPIEHGLRFLGEIGREELRKGERNQAPVAIFFKPVRVSSKCPD